METPHSPHNYIDGYTFIANLQPTQITFMLDAAAILLTPLLISSIAHGRSGELYPNLVSIYIPDTIDPEIMFDIVDIYDAIMDGDLTP
jgi:hypothetical protein